MPLSDLQRRKLTRFFTIFDQDRDGVITRIDYVVLAESIARGKGYPIDSPLCSRLKECLLQVWSNLEIIADKDHNSQVTLEEFLDYRDKLHQDDVKLGDLVTAGLTLFDVMDSNHDGKLEPHEFELFYSFFQLEAELADEMFQKLDVESAGFLTRQQIQTYSREFNFGDDPEAVGNWLFGPY